MSAASLPPTTLFVSTEITLGSELFVTSLNVWGVAMSLDIANQRILVRYALSNGDWGIQWFSALDCVNTFYAPFWGALHFDRPANYGITTFRGRPAVVEFESGWFLFTYFHPRRGWQIEAIEAGNVSIS